MISRSLDPELFVFKNATQQQEIRKEPSIPLFFSTANFRENTKIQRFLLGGRKMKAYIGEERFILTGKAWQIRHMLKQYSKHHIWVTEMLKKQGPQSGSWPSH
jgi:hypothetical protein